MIDNGKVLAEVDEILHHFPHEHLLKIPGQVRDSIAKYKDTSNEWKYDITKPLKDQNVSKDAMSFLIYLNMEYILNHDQKLELQGILESNEKAYESLAQDFNFEEVFKTNDAFETTTIESQNECQLTEKNEKNFFEKILLKIKKMLGF